MHVDRHPGLRPRWVVASGPARGGYPGSLLARRCCLPQCGQRRLPQRSTLSGLNPTARTLTVYASPRRLPGRHARLASGWWPTLPVGTFTRGLPCEVSVSASVYMTSSSPRLRLAHPHRIAGRIGARNGRAQLGGEAERYPSGLLLNAAARSVSVVQPTPARAVASDSTPATLGGRIKASRTW